MKLYSYLMVEKFWALVATAVLVSTLLLGCESPAKYPSAFEAEPSPPPRVAIGPGDVVEIKFFYTPRLDETQTVRPDGKIMLQLIGEIEVQGKTPAELRAQLMNLYEPHLNVVKSPEVAVFVRSFFSRRVFVGGQVMIPGTVEMPAKLTVLEAIMQAGGFDMREAEVRNIIVIRHKEGQRYGYSLNLKPMMTGGEIQPFFLEPRDIVYVPRTEIAKAGQWVDQYINKLIPQSGFTFSRRSGRTIIGMDTSAR